MGRRKYKVFRKGTLSCDPFLKGEVAGGGAQGLVHAGQALYHSAPAPVVSFSIVLF